MFKTLIKSIRESIDDEPKSELDLATDLAHHASVRADAVESDPRSSLWDHAKAHGLAADAHYWAGDRHEEKGNPKGVDYHSDLARGHYRAANRLLGGFSSLEHLQHVYSKSRVMSGDFGEEQAHRSSGIAKKMNPTDGDYQNAIHAHEKAARDNILVAWHHSKWSPDLQHRYHQRALDHYDKAREYREKYTGP